MGQSLCKIYLHIIFHKKTISPPISKEHLTRVFEYIAQLVNTSGNKTLMIGGIEDHIHALIILGKNNCIPSVVEEIKRNSSRWIKSLSPIYGNFAWQGGYAVFSVSQSQIDIVKKYIKNQHEHHKKQSSHDEYLKFLQLYGIKYEEKYVLSD